ncbi:MAG TPA: potassium transporter Kup [Candidatus Binataceae bacterium]|nr:potassium transporter Kup [Candidatus Binataceae bacterium]
MTAAQPERPTARTEPEGTRLATLSLAALGVVYGDIGTSPLYAFRECLHGYRGVPPSAADVLGILSLIFWALLIVISVKYALIVTRADNDGDGGIIALVALLGQGFQASKGRRAFLIALGLFGAALLYGDGTITPAISVLSAIEGLREADPDLAPFVVPITCAILILLFTIQKRGTGRIGAVFGPLMVVWFAVLAALGIGEILRAPRILTAVNPIYAVTFFRSRGFAGFRIIGAVFLVVTGGEALYADMGHFGARPIRLAWFSLVLPALLLNYFGQGALVLTDPQRSGHPFYDLAPQWALYPIVALATCATIIASQAVIAGAFSLTRQAIELGYWPRMNIAQTSPEEIGQVYVPGMNSMFLVGTLALVVGFGSSSRLAGAYGVGVSTTMVITTILIFVVARDRWHWHPAVAGLICAPLLAVDLAFFSSNMLKIPDGGWFPLCVGLLGYTLMSTWRRGRQILLARLSADIKPVEVFLERIAKAPPTRMPGDAIYLSGRVKGAPPMLVHQLERERVLRERVILLTILTEEMPRVPAARRLEIEALNQGFVRIVVHYGFMQNPNVPAALRLCERFGLTLDLDRVTYYTGHESLVPTDRFRGMLLWRKKLFAFMSRNAPRATAFFRLPPGQVVEIGTQVEF